MEAGPIFLKTSGPLSLMTTNRMNLISARSISPDSTFHESLNSCAHDQELGALTEELAGRLKFSGFWLGLTTVLPPVPTPQLVVYY
jgi:hypothetical protein